MTTDPGPAGPELVDRDTVTTAVVRGVVPTAELPGFYDRAFTAIGATLAGQGIAPGGPAFGLYHGPPGEETDVEVGFPTDREVHPEGDVRVGSLPAGRVARLVHAGGFDGLGEAWGRLGGWIGEQGLTPGAVMWEVYLTEPSPEMDPADLRTELNWPVTG